MLQSIMGHSSIEITMNVYTHLSESDLLDSFEVVGRNRNFDFYSLTRIPELLRLMIQKNYQNQISRSCRMIQNKKVLVLQGCVIAQNEKIV